MRFMKMLTRHLAVIVLMLGLGTTVVGARQAPAPAAPAAATTNAVGPKIHFAEPMYDFGKMQAGEPVKHTYVFTNTGDSLLILNSVQPQCGCTTAGQWTKEVAPGQAGSIPIQFNTTAYNGPVFKQVTVTCNVTSQPTLFLQLRGTVYRPYEVSPPLAVLNVPADRETASAVVTITNHTDQPFIVFQPQSANRMFSAELTTNVPGKSYQITVSTVPPLSPGNVQGQITVKSSWTNTPVIAVTVVANVQPPVMVIPPQVTLAPGPLTGPVTNSVTVQNNSTNVMQLSEPVVNVPGVEAWLKETSPGRSYTASMAFPQGFEVPPGQHVELSIKSSNPRFPVVKVPVVQMPRPVVHTKPLPSGPIVAPGQQPPPPANRPPSPVSLPASH